jgi:D,D-heptose 1,7-bisphosphate phosphatase
MKRAVFIDKDGTLVTDVPYNADPAKITLAPFAGMALARLKQAGFLLVLVTNQSGVARGYFPEIMLVGVFNQLNRLLGEEGVRLDDCFYCPHHPQAVVKKYRCSCDCRKPQPGMLLEAAKKHDLDLGQSWMIGDILDDVEAGARAGCRTILLDNGHETLWQPGPCRRPSFTVPTLKAAAATILHHSNNLVYGLTF